jgi:hypothetical protein
MSDRKYRQRGYQDDSRPQRGGGDGAPRKPLEPYDPRIARDPRVPNMPGFREVVRCAKCGALGSVAIGPESECGSCGAVLHTCGQCESFDPGATFECRQSIPARVTPKDARNSCALFSARIQVERQTHSTPAPSSSAPSGARKAFDDLFKF